MQDLRKVVTFVYVSARSMYDPLGYSSTRDVGSMCTALCVCVWVGEPCGLP